MKILYYSPSSYGGIADYAHEQANALSELGIEVDFLCTPDYPTHRATKYNRLAQLEELRPKNITSVKLVRAWRYLYIILANYWTLAAAIKKGSYQYVLLGSYAEYFAPLWAGQFRKLAKQGVTFGAVVHDPVRDFVLGSFWWHRWSVSQAYSFLREAFVHEPIDLDTGIQNHKIRTTVVPFGMYHFPESSQSRLEVRQHYKIPDNASLMLAFGHIRDGKNLDILIHAMKEIPGLYLLIAGKEQSSDQKPASFYQELATQLGLAERCRWRIGFLPETEVADLFNAADIAVMTYSKDFRSASSVLSVATNYKKICLVSSGESSLKSTVNKYSLGVWVAPDSCSSIRRGLEQLLERPPIPRWDDYFKNESWQKNAQFVINSLETR